MIRTMRLASRPLAVAACVVAMAASAASAEIIGGIEFPQGIAAFADEVVAYTPGAGIDAPDVRWQNPADALGTPNYTPPLPGATEHNIGQFVSLGNGGSLTLKFTDNFLSGCGTSCYDLWIFEVGPVVESMSVEISKDGATWYSVGSVGGATAGVDIDAYGFSHSDHFYYVRLTDDPNQWPQSDHYGKWSGADIDAVAVIHAPEPATMLMTLLGVPYLAMRWRRNRRA
ncbi:MAG: PEP-CTERM sorting domain-containing protein [Planctomycetaceae bacterium]|nr:PEP-CTERM sorting domain-containing protein [Planctomycetaceae bacterium]